MSILFLGGDERQRYASDYLCKHNYESIHLGSFELNCEFSDIIASTKMIVLPLPVSKDGIHLGLDDKNVKIQNVLDSLPCSCTVMGGKIPHQIVEMVRASRKICVDYYNNEKFQIRNALLSAEGAIYYAKSYFEGSIYGSNIAILGFGRIAKILAYLLHAQGAEITICARKDTDLIWSKLVGFNIVSIKDPISNFIDTMHFDIIFNTVPYWIITEELAQAFCDQALLIDLASPPYGIDPRLVGKYKLNYRIESGIPGRYAPKSAGELIAQAVIDYLEVMGGELC